MKTNCLLRFVAALILALAIPALAKATHIVGGEITYACLGNNQYEITLNVYRDCFNGREPFDNPGYIGIYNLRGDLIQTLQLRPGARDTLDPSLEDPCLVVPGTVCVDTLRYKGVVTLSNNPEGGAYQITYVRCCRNKTISNLVAPEETGAVYDIYLTRDAMLQCNNSPVFNRLPPNFICANKPFNFDHSATDADGDSLVYSLCTPYSGGSVSTPRPIPPRNPPPFDEVIWQTGFGLDNLFGQGTPLRIDARTGLLTAVPGLQGQFVVGVCVEEYDRVTKQLLSTVRRDFQYNVGICGEIVAAFATPQVSCSPTVTFENQSQNAENFRWYFDFPRTNLTSTERSPTVTFPDTGTYTVALIAEPGSNCVDTFFQQITIRNNTINIDFQIENFDCQSQAILALGDLSTDPNGSIVQWQWRVTYGDVVALTSNLRTPTFIVPLNVQGTIQLTVTSSNGCTQTLQKPFQTGNSPSPVENIPDTITVCQGAQVALNPNAPSSSNLTYRWSPGRLLNDSTAANPIFIANQITVFTVTVTQDTAICQVSKTVTVLVRPAPVVNLGADRTTCVGDTITLTANVTGGTAPYQFNWNIGSGQSQRVSPSVSTTYIVTVTDANGCSGTDSVRVTVNPAVTFSLTATATSICSGDSTTIQAVVSTGQAPYTFNWNPALSNAATQVVRPTQTTTYAVTVTDANGCTATGSLTTTVNPSPQARVDTAFCTNNFTTYQVNLTVNAGTVTTSAGTVINNGSGSFAVINIPAGQNVIITTALNNCQTVLNITAPPCQCPEIAAPISGGNQVACAGSPFPALTVTVPTGQTADWFATPTGGTPLLQGSTSFTPTQAGTYYARARDLATSCTSAMRTAVTLTTSPAPNATATASALTICAGDSVRLNANASGGTPPYTFVWNQGVGQGQSRFATPLTNTNYVVTVTDANGCSDTAQVTITVNPLPRIDSISSECSVDLTRYTVRIVTNGDIVVANVGTVVNNGTGRFTISNIPVTQDLVLVATFNLTRCGRLVSVNRPNCQCPDVAAPTNSGGDQTICAGQPIPPLTVSVGANQTADWYTAATGGTPILTGSLNFTPMQAGTYYAVARDTITQCTSRVRTPVRLTVNAAPTVAATANDTSICTGQSANLSASANGGTAPYTFSWNQNLGTGANKTVNPTQTTLYIVTVTDALGCTGVDSITITVNPNPTATIAASDTTICAGDTATLTASATGGNAPYTFQWNQGLGAGATKTVTPTQTTTYLVTATDTSGCSDTATVTITVRPRPMVQLTAGRTTICAGDTTQLTVTASGGTAPYTFQWNQNIVANNTVIVNPTQTTTYTVTVTDANGCTNTASIIITVTQSLNVAITANDSTLCVGQSANLRVSISNGARPFRFNWNQNLPADSTQTVTPTQSTTYAVTVTDASGCIGTDTIRIVVNPNPTVVASANDSTICSGTTANLSATASGGTGPYTFNWNPGNLSGPNPTVNPTDTTTYTVVVTDSNGCTASDQVTIFVTPPPVANAGASDLTICAGDSTTLIAGARGGLPPYTFNWDNGLGTGANKTVTPQQTTTYTVTVTDANGCADTTSVTITVSPGPNASIAATASTICQGDSTTLAASVNGGTAPYRFRWIPPIDTVGLVIVRPNQTTTYAVIVTDATGCSDTAQTTITVNPKPTVEISTDRDDVCAGSPAVLTAEASGVTGNLTYRWSNGATTRQITVNPTTTTTYTVTVTAANGCTGVDSTTIIVNPAPVAAIRASSNTVCLGGSSTLIVTATGGTAPYTFQWDQNLGVNDTVIVRPTQNMTYTVIVTDANGCRDTAQISITVTQGLNVDLTTNDSTICRGDSATLTATVATGQAPYQYTWSPALPGNQTNTVRPAQTTTYRVTVTDANGCVGTDSIVIVVHDPPVLTLTASKTTICEGDSVTVRATVTGGTGPYTFRWNLRPTIGDTIQISPTDTVTCIVIVTDANGCSDTARIQINVHPKPEATIQAQPATVCLGGSTTLRVNIADGARPYRFTWNQGLPADSVQTVRPTQNTTYSVTVTDANGCTDTAQITITVTDGLNVNLTANDSILCQGESATLTANVSNGQAPYQYAWSPALANNQTNTVNPAQTTTYRVTVTDANGCTGTDSIVIRVNPAPVVSITADKTTLCLRDSAQLTVTATGGTPPLTYRWSNGFNGINQTVRPVATTTYTLTVTDANGCSDTAAVTISVNPRPTVNAGADTVSCSGTPIPLNATATGGTPPYTFQWDQNLGAGASKTVTPAQPTTYTVTVTDANGCTNTDQVFVDVFPLPTDLPPDSTTICANTPTPLAPNIVPRPGATYQWRPAGILSDPNIPNPIITTNRDTTVFVTITYRGVCSVLETVRVRVSPPINLQASGDTTLCTTDSLTLTATTNSAANVDFVWSTSRTLQPPIGTGRTIRVLPTGNVIYYVRAMDNNGCSQTDSVIVNSFPIRATLPPRVLLCEPTNPVRLAVTNPDAVQRLTYNWLPSNAIPGHRDSAVVFVDPNLASVFTVELVNQFGCRDTLQTNVRVSNLNVTATASPTTIFAGQTTQLNVLGGCPTCTYTWTPTEGLNNPNIANPLASPTVTTTYRVTVRDSICTDESAVTVTVNSIICDKDHVFLPNAFSPNGDGINDVWQIRSNFRDQLVVVSWVLYNRWGQKIFETTDPNFQWDGTFRGQPLPPDVYGFYLRVICPGGEELIQQGNLTLLR